MELETPFWARELRGQAAAEGEPAIWPLAILLLLAAD